MTVTRAMIGSGMRAARWVALLAVPTFLGSEPVEAAAFRWSQPAVTPTLNDGLELAGISLQGQTMFHSLSTPYFLFNGHRYELGEFNRSSAPRLTEGDGLSQYSADYAVPVRGGVVHATVHYTFLDYADPESDAAQISAWIQFKGPQGDYRFFWRMDVDPGSRGSNLVSLGDDADSLMTQERHLTLGNTPLRVTDSLSYQQQTRLELMPVEADQARVSVIQFHGGETEALPQTLVNAEAMTGRRDGGDTVVWYETQLNGVSSGMTGPDMQAIAATRVNAILEQDKMAGAEFVVSSVNVYNQERSFQGAFKAAGINVVDMKNDESSLTNDTSSTNAELHSLMVASKDFEYQDSSTQWYSWVGTVQQSSSGASVLGIMFDDGSTNTDSKPRQGCAVFYNPHKNGTWPTGDTYMAELLLTLTHETGHVYNQHHEDYCSGRFSGSTFRTNSAIMGYAFMDTSRWTFSGGTITTLSSEPEEYSRPGHGYAFTTSGSYNMTTAHEGLHSSTSCRKVCCLNQ